MKSMKSNPRSNRCPVTSSTSYKLGDMENTDPAGVDNVVVRPIYKKVLKCSFIISYQNMIKKRLCTIHLKFTNEKHVVQ